MKIWVDPIKEAPKGYEWCKSVNETVELIAKTSLAYNQELLTALPIIAMDDYERSKIKDLVLNHCIEIIDMSHDAADMKSDGGNYINILYWLEEVGPKFPVKIRIHSDHPMNPIGVQMIRSVINRNGWTELSNCTNCHTCEYEHYEAYDEICARCENCNGYTEKKTITNRDWLNSLSNKEYVEFLCSDEFDILKRSFTQTDIGLYEWLNKPTDKKIIRK